MIQKKALEVYAYIEGWWGESLTPELARRISEAPATHLKRFEEDWPDNSWTWRSGHLDHLGGGDLRPVFGQRNVSDEQSIANRMLLYVPSTVLDANILDPLAPITWRGVNEQSRTAIRSLLTWLAETKTLVEDGSILYSGKAAPRTRRGTTRPTGLSPSVRSGRATNSRASPMMTSPMRLRS